MAASSPVRLPLERQRRRRIGVLWAIYAIGALALILTLQRWYSAVREDVAAQSERAIQGELRRVQGRLDEIVAELRHHTEAKLAGLHEEGLEHALNRWDAQAEEIVGVFTWRADAGFSPESHFPAGVQPQRVATLWAAFQAWRKANPAGPREVTLTTDDFGQRVTSTVDPASFAATELGYQGENLESIAYRGGRADPWAAWATPLHAPDVPWVVWYAASAEGPVRGGFIAKAPVIARLQPELADTQSAQIALIRDGGAQTATSKVERSLAPTLPGYRLVGNDGELVTAKHGTFRLLAVVAALLVAVFLLGTAALALYSTREIRDAERKATFVSHVSHELRTPLTSIRMFAEMLQNDALPPAKQARYAARICEESTRLSRMIEHLLTFSALQRSRTSVVVAPIDVGPLVRTVVEDIEPQVAAAGMRLVTTPPGGPAIAQADSSVLKQALLNLVDNAVKYASAGRAVRLDVGERDGEVTIRVSDEGPGIPADMHERIFEPFVQLGRSLTDKSPGIGLGLTIARDQLRQAGGDLVLLRSARGAVFEIRLPRPVSA